ncbi:22289_t:CDS:2 [Cetraspora pellucida]|uniref:3-hydroxyisobutyrate dehydrogenase n=1 Tax=Cetraspora pellucida TaxID=1433469 RepID=A0A9N9CIU5_9GLOM|nr:22289_t:CDS:2 [Cetraspora pellucida]
MPSLPADCLSIIFMHFYNDLTTLYYCLLVNTSWCATAIPILWSNPWKYHHELLSNGCLSNDHKRSTHVEYQSLLLLKTLSACFSAESKQFLLNYGIRIDLDPPLFNYAKYCRSLDTYDIDYMLRKAQRNHLCFYTEDTRDFLGVEVYRLFFHQSSKIARLTISHQLPRIYSQIWFFPDTLSCFATLKELSCYEPYTIDLNLLKYIAGASSNIRKLSLDSKLYIHYDEGLIDLIQNQNNLNSLSINNISYGLWLRIANVFTSGNATSLTHLYLKSFDTCFPVLGISELRNLRSLIITCHEVDWSGIANACFPFLEILEFGRYFPSLTILASIISRTNKLLKRIYLSNYLCADPENSGMLFHAIIDFCPNLRYLSIPFNSISDETLEDIRHLLDSCHYLEGFSLRAQYSVRESMEYDKRLLEGDILFNLFIDHAPNTLCNIKFDYSEDEYETTLTFSYAAIKSFLMNWEKQKRIKLGLFIVIEDFNMHTHELHTIEDMLYEYRVKGVLETCKLIPKSPLIFSVRAEDWQRHSKNDTIGFIGLGQMGFRMANNLYTKSNFSLVIHDINKSSIEKFTSLHSTTISQKPIYHAKSPAEVARKASVIITMLPSSPHVKDVYLGKDGLIEGLDNQSFFIDSSTIDQSVSKDVAQKVIDKGARQIDAPVSGGVVGAEAATLTFMVGASTEADFLKSKPYLTYMGKNIVHCGGLGTGQIAKICNNMLLAISMIGVSEAMNLGIKLGIDPKLLADILNTSSGRCWSSDTYNPCPGIMPNVPSSKDYEGGFGNTLIAKDLRLAVNAANDVQATIILGAITQQIYNALSKSPDYEKKDFSSIYKWLNERSGNK